ncbi:MAG: threonylcarbamoyl-AMP synthase [Succinivibrionaceae bacterium]|nr:threonylcarbamoyl-AMP synthase [Succinivibrionaceae bacterium]
MTDGPDFQQAVAVLRSGGIIAYPTEAVYGLGCDPDNVAALRRLLELKQRPESKGMLVVAHSFELVRPYLDLARVPEADLDYAASLWPGFCTLVFPASDRVSPALRGSHDTLAVRISAHPSIAEICSRLGRPLVSTSANLSGGEPCRDAASARRIFDAGVDYVVAGECLGYDRPSTIIDLRTRKVLRK